MKVWHYSEPKMLIRAAATLSGEYSPFTATVYDEDGQQAICLMYMDYRWEIPGVRQDRRPPTAAMKKVEETLGISPEEKPKWYRV